MLSTPNNRQEKEPDLNAMKVVIHNAIKPQQSRQNQNVLVGTNYTIGMSRALDDELLESQFITEEKNRHAEAQPTLPDAEDKPESEETQTIKALQEQVVQFEEELRQKTNWVLRRNTLVKDFQKFR